MRHNYSHSVVVDETDSEHDSTDEEYQLCTFQCDHVTCHKHVCKFRGVSFDLSLDEAERRPTIPKLDIQRIQLRNSIRSDLGRLSHQSKKKPNKQA